MDLPTKQFADLFWRSPVGKKLLNDAGKERQEKRRAAAERHARNKEQGTQRLEALAAQKAVAAAQVVKQRAALKESERKHNSIAVELMGAQTQLDNEQAREEKFLRETADGELGPFLKNVDEKYAELLLRSSYESQRELVTLGYSIEGGLRHGIAVRDNSEQLRQRAEALAEARHQAIRICETRADVTTEELEELLLNDLPDHHLPRA